MRLSRRELTIAAGLILAFAVPLTVTLLLTRSEAADSKPQTKPASVRMHRLVLPINTDDPTTMRALISTSLNLPKYYQERNEAFTIEVVAYNAGVHMLRADTSPVKDMLRRPSRTPSTSRSPVPSAQNASRTQISVTGASSATI